MSLIILLGEGKNEGKNEVSRKEKRILTASVCLFVNFVEGKKVSRKG